MDKTRDPECKNTRLIEVGERFLRQILTRLMASRALKHALRFDPNMRMSGAANYTLRAQVRVVKKLAKTWIWLQAQSEGGGKSAATEFRAKTEVTKTPCPGGYADTPRRNMGQNTPLVEKRPHDSMAEFRPRCSFVVTPSRKWAAKNTLPAPMPAVQTIKVNILPEAQAWLFGQTIMTLLPQAPPLNVAEPVRPNIAGSNAPRAGQIFADLQYLAAVVDAPDAVITKVARRLARTSPPPSVITANATPSETPMEDTQTERPNTPKCGAVRSLPPRVKPPGKAALEKLGLPIDLHDWWHGVSARPEPLGILRAHPPPI